MPVSLDLPGARRFMATDAAVESRSVGVGRCGRPPCVPGTSTDGRCERSDPGPRGGAHPLAGTARARLRRARCRPVHDRELPGCRGARVHAREGPGHHWPPVGDGERHPHLQGRLRLHRRCGAARDVRLRLNRSVRARFGLASARLHGRHHARRPRVDGSPSRRHGHRRAARKRRHGRRARRRSRGRPSGARGRDAGDGEPPDDVEGQGRWSSSEGGSTGLRRAVLPPHTGARHLFRAEDGFGFASDAVKRARSTFAELGTEQNGLFFALATRCPRCGAP